MRKQARSWFYKALGACHQRKWRMLTWCTLLATWKHQQLFRLLVCFAGWRGCRKRKRMYCRLRWAMRPYWHHVRIHQPQSPVFQPSCTVWDKNWEKPGNRFTYFWLPLWWGVHHWACLFVLMQPQCGWCEAWHLAGMWITLYSTGYCLQQVRSVDCPNKHRSPGCYSRLDQFAVYTLPQKIFHIPTQLC